MIVWSGNSSFVKPLILVVKSSPRATFLLNKQKNVASHDNLREEWDMEKIVKSRGWVKKIRSVVCRLLSSLSVTKKKPSFSAFSAGQVWKRLPSRVTALPCAN